MIQLKLEANGKYYYYDPLEKLIIPNGYQLNENLQHQETQVSLRIAYDSELHKILVENQNIPAKLIDDEKILFTGIIDSGISWTDNGNPEPLECFNITIFDNSGKLQATTESEFAKINKSLTEIIVAICDKCGIICSRTNFPVDDPIVPVFILPAEKEFYQPLSELLFEYGYAFGFDNNGYFGLINLTQPQSTTFHDDLYEGVKFSRTKKKYTGLSVTYGQLVQKNNEQVFFEGGDLDAENKILPIVIQPGAYYPWESDPIIEVDEGQVFQQFAAGFAEEKTLYNGEKKYQRNNNSKLIYTTNHELVQDFSSNLTVDRKEFSFTQASIRFHNKSTTDATLKQLAIRATAYYRQEQQIILGSGKKFEYQTNYLYDKTKTDAFVEILKKYFLGGNFKITFKTDAEFTPGTKTKLTTGLSGITADVLILSCEKDFDNENYTINAITIQDISLDEKKYQTQKSMTADQRIQRTEYTTTSIKTIQEEYYQSTSRTELIGGKWQTTPPTPSTNTYIWTRTHFIYNDGTEVTTDPVSVSGENGDNLESVDVEYAQNQSRTTAPTTGWQTTAPTAKDNYYTWSRTKIKLKNEDATYTDAVCITGDKGNTGDKGDTGAKGDKGEDGKNAITMTSATTPNGEYNGQIGIWQGQIYQWNGTSWMATSGILPTDPVLHYSFDDVPDFPEGTNIFTGVLTGPSFSKEDIKGGYRFIFNGIDPYVQFRTVREAFDSLALCYRQKAISKTGGVYINESYIFYTDGSYFSIRNYIPTPTEAENIVRTIIPCDRTKKIDFVRLDMFSGEGHSAVIDVTDIYIGDTSYATPVIDNSGNNNNATDVKGLVTKGVSGKAIKKINGSDKITTNFSLSGDFSWSVWCRDFMTDTARTLYICSGRRVSDGAGDQLTYVQAGTGRIEVGSESDWKLSVKSIYSFGDSIWHLYTTVRQGRNYLLYKDGIYQETITVSSVEDIKFLTIANRFLPYAEEQQIGYDFDDFQIFDRALSDQEVLGLYLARGNTPKQYTFADYQLDNSSGKYYGYEKPAVPFKNDTYLDTTTGYLYEYDGVKWVAITDVTDTRYNQAVNDMIAFATNNPTLPFLTARNAWIERLAVDGLLANKIATQELKIKNGGIIRSNNYNGTVKDGVITESGTEGWAIDSTGTAEFNNGVIKTPELNFYGVSGVQNNKIEDAFFLKSLFSDFGNGVYDNHIFRSNGVNTDSLFISSYIGTSYEMSFSGTLSIYLAKYENIFISISCKSVIFKVVKTKVSRNKNSAFPSYTHEVMATQAFTENYSNNWVCGVSNKIINIDVDEGDLITCYIEGLYSGPLFEAATMYANSITSDGLFAYESAMFLGKTNTLVRKLLVPSESVFNRAIIATKASDINNIQGVGNFAKYVLIGNVLIQWGQTLSYTVPPGQRFEEIINLPIAYISSGDILGSGATGLSGYNVIMSSSAKDVDGGFEYNESWASRTNSSFKIRAYNRNVNTTIERWSIRWLTIGYIN